MSLLGRIFGGRSFEEERAHAEDLFDAGNFGLAKLAFEKALEKAPGDGDRDAIRERIDASLDSVARTRIAAAQQYQEEGDLDLALSELEGALDTAVSEEVLDEAQRLVDGLEREDAVRSAEVQEVTDEDRLAAIAGTWEDDQDEEYAGYGDDVTDALLALEAERFADATKTLEALLDASEAPRYLWFEVGRARILSGDDDGGVDALESFLDLMGPDEGGESRLAAHMLLARVFDEAGDVDAAVEEFERAAEALDDDPRPLLELGRYLRRRERVEDAVEVLELAVESSDPPGWALLQELGLGYADCERDDKAVETLEGVIAFMVSQHHLDFPVLTALTLARLHEKAGRKERAADMYRSLSRGSDRANHFVYHYEAGRLLSELGVEEEALRMLKRASGLSEERIAALATLEVEGDEERAALELAQGAAKDHLARAERLLAEAGGEPSDGPLEDMAPPDDQSRA